MNNIFKADKVEENCWSVWLSGCQCCEDGWHWMMTSMGSNAEEDAKLWMVNMSKILKEIELK